MKNYYKAFFKSIILLGLFFFTNNLSAQWVQAGQDIDGENEEDQSGYSLAMNADGSIIAIGSVENSDAGQSAGHVRVFKYANEEWVQIGNDIDGEGLGQEFGYSLAMSDNGSILAVSADGSSATNSLGGIVKVYKYIDDVWTQIGETMQGDGVNDKFGRDIDLNGSGEILAAGAWLNDTDSMDIGQVKIFQLVDNSWEDLGQYLYGINSHDNFGISVSLNEVGNRLAVGSVLSSSEDLGKVTAFELAEDIWVPLSPDIIGEINDGWFGYYVDLNNDGNILAVSSKRNQNSLNYGAVSIYQLIEGIWIQMGEEISGQGGSNNAYKIDLNGEGNIIAIGARGNDNAGYNTGNVRIFEFEDDTWVQLGEELGGEFEVDQFGYQVCLNETGYVVAGSARWNDGNGEDSGHARVFTYGPQALSTSSYLSDLSTKIYPNPTSDFINIEGDQITSVSLISMEGKMLKTIDLYKTSTVKLDLSSYPPGIYFLQIKGTSGIESQKVVIY